jgi:long-chain acyl-CoA synthetase
MQRRSLAEYFPSFAAHGEEIAIVHRHGYRIDRWSYGRVARTACQFARELEARGVARGSRVLIWGENSAEWVAAFLGCVLRGAVVVPMDRIAAPEFVRRVAQQVECKFALIPGEVLPAVTNESLLGATPVMPLESLAGAVVHRDGGEYVPPAFEPSDTLEIVFTSGTTAEPRGVVLTHGNILANLEPLEAEIQKYRRYERIFHPLRFLELLPLSHVFGQMLGIFLPPLLGATVIFLDTLSPAEIASTIRRERVSVLVTVPRLVESLRDKVKRDLEAAGRLPQFQKDFESAAGEHFLKRWWRFRRIHREFGWKFWALISGGAALPADAEAFWGRLGYAVIQGYGLTETASLVSVNHPFRRGQGSIGKVLPGFEVQLDASGEILVRGENVAAGYWQGRQLEPVAGRDGWFHTGDLGERDADGNLYFKGRRKSVIVSPAGMNIYPGDLEAALRGQHEVRDCVVIGLERDGNAEPCAVLLLRDRASDAEAVVRRANASLAEYQQMRRWFVWPEQDFPRTPTQKPLLPRIREAVEAEESKPGARGAASPLAELIARITGRATSPLSAGTHLAKDLNLSSLDRVELLSALEERYQVDLRESGFSETTTVGDLERLLREPASSGVAPGKARREPAFVFPRWAQRWPVTWIRGAVYYLLMWPAVLLLGRPRISGRENLDGVRGPVLVIANHATYLDPAFVLAALPRRLRRRLAVAMEGERLRAMRYPPAAMGFAGRVLERVKYVLAVALFNVFPLPQKAGFRASFTFAGELVDRGWSVLIFPEGELTRDGTIAPFRAGIGLLGKELNLRIIPMRLDGLFALRQARRKRARSGEIGVRVGAPAQIDPAASAEDITRELEREVRSLGAIETPPDGVERK